MAGKPLKRARAEGAIELTPAIAAKIVTLVRHGAFLDHAMAAARVPSHMIQLWTRRAERDDAPEIYRKFAADLAAARAEDTAELRGAIKSQAADDWKAAAWLLERKHPKKYGSLAMANGAPTVPIQINVHAPDSPEVTAAVGRLGGASVPALDAGED